VAAGCPSTPRARYQTPNILRNSSMALSAGMSSNMRNIRPCAGIALELLSLGERTSVFRYTDNSMALEKPPVAACALKPAV